MRELLPFLGQWSWWVIGAILLLLELVLPGVFFMWLGIAALVIGVIDIFFDFSWQVEVAIFGGEYQEGTLTAFCAIDDVPHVELNGHILIPLQNVASLHCSSRCDAPEPDWPPRGFAEDEGGES